MLSTLQLRKGPLVGNDAGWALAFFRENDSWTVADQHAVLTITRDDYYADIQATLPSDLAGGTYKFTIEGLTDEAYGQIAPFTQRRPDEKPKPTDKPSVIRLYLYWRDTNASVGGYLTNLAGLNTSSFSGFSPDALKDAYVAELAIVSITRQAGERRYETVITAQERVFKRLAEKRLAAALDPPDKTLHARAARLAADRGVTLVPNASGLPAYGFNADGSLPPVTGAAPGTEEQASKAGDTYAALMTNVGTAVSRHLSSYGRGMLLIRKGSLHLGKRPIPLEGDPIRLSFTNGLVASSRTAPVAPSQPDAPARGGGAGGGSGGGGLAGAAASALSDVGGAVAGTDPKTGDQWTLTLKGRPDVKPGDIVIFHPPPEEISSNLVKTLPGSALAAIGGSLVGSGSFLSSLLLDESSAPEQTLYVNSVAHRLGRSAGFVTTVTGVALAQDARDARAWDPNPPANASDNSTNAGRAQGSTGSSATDAAAAVRTAAEAVAAQFRHPDVAEVRATNATGTGSAEPPSQTETVWRGLMPTDSRPSQTRRLAIRRTQPEAVNGIAYASPFAWGKCGLVLPRYPGTRVVLVHRNGDAADPVEVGALWESGHGPESHAGDWWLILPVGVSQSSRASIPDSETAPTEHTGNVTNDLIDADGNRVIEVGELTLRVTRNSLKQAGQRPDRGSEQDGITIEHADGGAKITVSHDGKITIHAKQGLELVAEQGDVTITAQSGDLKLQANNIDAQVSGQMNVH